MLMRTGILLRRQPMGWLLGLFLLVTGNVAAAVPLVDDASTRVFPHIKIFARAIGLTSEQKDWYKTHVDIVMGDSKVPGTSIKYVSWSDLAQSRPQYFALYKVLDAAGSDFNQAFLHYSQDVLLPANNSDPFKQGSTAISLREDKFFRVGIVSGSIWMGSNDAKFGNALDFDGNNPGFQISSKLGDQVLSGYTLDLWMKPAQQVSTTIATWNAGINGLWIDADGHLVMECNVDHQRKGAARYAFPVFNQWYHVVGVCSAAQGIVRLYVNGQEVGSGVTFTPGVMTIDKRMFSVAGTSSKYRGGLDDLRIYNRALTAAEVRDRYVSNTMVSNGLIGYWKFDEGEGTVVADAIGSENSFLFPIDMSSQAYGDPATNKTLPVTYDIVFGLKKNDSLYMGNPWKFGEVNFNLAQGAGAGWRGVWEYYNGSSWTSLFAKEDSTSGMQQSGKMSFIPPADWQKTYVGDAHIYWIRLRCSDPGAAELVFRSVERVSGSYVWEGTSGIHGQPYGHRVDSDGKNCLVISGWDMANDLNGDGYIDDTEFSIRKNNKASARFLSNAIVPADYFSNRWVMNIGHPVVSGYFATASKDAMNDAGMDGLFVDNSVGWIPDLKKSDYRYLEYPQGDHEAKYLQATVDLHRAIKEQAGNRPVFLNSGGIYPDVVAPVDGSFIEWAFTFDNSSKVTPVFLSSYLAKVNMYKKLGKQVVLSAGPANWDNVLPADLAKERHQLYSLAMYYLLAQENTYFEYFLSNAPWQDWAKAFEVDIGKPLGDFYLYKQLSGHDFSSSSSNLMANASFEAKKTGNLSLPDGWINSTWYGAGVGETVSQSGKFGDYALRLDSDSKNNCGGMFQYIALKPNTTYTLGAWIKTENLVSDYSLAAEVIVYGGKSGGDWRAG